MEHKFDIDEWSREGFFDQRNLKQINLELDAGNRMRIVRDAKYLIEKGWSQKASARDKTGRACSTYSRHAVSYCATGALCVSILPTKRTRHGDSWCSNKVWKLWQKISQDFADSGIHDIPKWNDEEIRTKEQVTSRFDKVVDLIKRNRDE